MPSSLITKQLYERRINQYALFVGFFRSQRGVQAFLERSDLLHPRMKVLDAGCGFGLATFALLDALAARDMASAQIDAFDLTPIMLDRFRAELDLRNFTQVQMREANILDSGTLPRSWCGYDLVISASMLEYLPHEQLPEALSALRWRMRPGASLLAIITRKSLVTKTLIEWAWKAEGYSAKELREAFSQAGFLLEFSRFPRRYGWLNRANHVVVARRIA